MLRVSDSAASVDNSRLTLSAVWPSPSGDKVAKAGHHVCQNLRGGVVRILVRHSHPYSPGSGIRV
jgi:hypothetical protein